MYRTFLILLLFISQTTFSQIQHPNDDDRTIKMPIVFHVIYTNSVDSISEETILSELANLNQDYSASNDMSMVENRFKTNIGNPNILFHMLDSSFQENIKGVKYIKSENPVGSSPMNISPLIDSKSTLNIYVYKMGGASTPRPGDFVRIDFNYIGSGTHTLTHEIGHAFGLWHLWGQVSNCNKGKAFGAKMFSKGSDDVDDTPPQFSCTDWKGKYQKCPINKRKFKKRNYNNFMDYNACRCMFTNGQVLSMRRTIIERHPELFNSSLD
ncbi:MAG: hypothetical protein COA38_06350 [Fluviicola sp.]|nr:MAG: hypothetical protein COA38_06350 [Fluviicola sp.]